MKKNKIAVFAMIMALFTFGCCFDASALTKRTEYQYDEKLHSVPGPQTYNASTVYYGNDLGVDGFSNPSDVYVDENKQIYIVDSGNNRIVIFDENFKFLRQIDKVVSPDNINELSDPKGVFARNGIVYICDTGNYRVIAVNDKNEVIRFIEGKDLMSVNKNFVFKPEKVVVDSNNNILISSSAIYQGILRFDSNDKFKAFFAPNEVTTSFSTFINSSLKKVFTDAQKESLQKSLPSPYSNIYIDSENFIYATAENVNPGQDIKRLNAAGTNILVYSSSVAQDSVFGDYESSNEKTDFIDINCDKDGYMLVADNSTQKLFLYDKECSLITVFGGKGNIKGRFVSISSVEKLNDDYIILDSELGRITVLSPNEYMKKILVAMTYYQNGEYESSEKLWQDILLENCNFPIAYKSLGRAQYHMGNYKLAMKYLKNGGDTYFYSLALNEYRKELIQKYFGLILLAVAAFIALFVFAVKRIKRFLKK